METDRMNLRRTLLILSVMAVFSAAAGGFFYYNSLVHMADIEANRQADKRVGMLEKTLSALLQEDRKPVRTLAGTPEIIRFVLSEETKDLPEVNTVLDHFQQSLKVDVCYIMNAQGMTIASSNHLSPESFVEKNFSFRPYFQEAIKGQAATYLALGTTSGRRGVYHSYPIFESDRTSPIGVAVIKDSIDLIEKKIASDDEEIFMVTSPQGVIFITNYPQWRFKLFDQKTEEEKLAISNSQQFGFGPWQWIGLKQEAAQTYRDKEHVYSAHTTPLAGYEGWTFILLRDQTELQAGTARQWIRLTGIIILLLCIATGSAVFILYQRASNEILQRKTVEKALKASEQRYRSLYNKTPAMLHSIDKEGRLLSVSDYWLKALGYEKEEVLGKKLTSFYREKSRKYAEEVVIPTFFKTGFCTDVPYQITKRDGTVMDIVLSAICERNSKGEIFRSLAVFVDVTERNRVEEALRSAKEALSNYSKMLEQEVDVRTHEIRQAQEQLRRLSASIMEGQEKERAVLARELHDELGQVLTALRLETVSIKEQIVTRAPQLHDRSERMCALIDTAIDEVRGLAFRLRPGALDDLGLIDALEVYTNDFERRTGTSCFFEHDSMPHLSNAIATAAYRITQEALTNVARYAETSHVEIFLKYENSQLTLIIHDEGRGFEPSECELESLGLAGMRERALLAGGALNIESTPGKGTTIVFEVPNVEQRA